MKQTIFETRQRAEELMQQAIEIWRKSDQSDQLEGIDTDPVFGLLITALAYQANETETDIEQMKADMLDDFAQMLTPYEVGHAIPATAVIQTALVKDAAEVELDSDCVFTLGEKKASFLPLLRTRLLNATVRTVVRLDSRRWKVTIDFMAPVSDLSGVSFCIRNQNYRDVAVSIDDQQLPLVKPWDFSELPMTKYFDVDTVLYNRQLTYMTSPVGLDLFARQNVRMYSIKKHKAERYIPTETDTLDVVFEFTGVGDDFVFDRNNLLLNTVMLANANPHTITLSSNSPIARVAGYDAHNPDGITFSQQFLHMIRPSEDQLFNDMPIEVRRMAADRFNQGRLAKLLYNIVNKYYSDFYAFQNVQEVATDRLIHALAETLMKLENSTREDTIRSASGVYLLLRPNFNLSEKQASVEVTYLTTNGSSVNSLLEDSPAFTVPAGLDGGATQLIANPMPGCDEIRDEKTEASLRRYYITTHDRLVTPADIKQFCYFELMSRYGIVRDMVKNITVSFRQEFEKRLSGYEILVEVTLQDSAFIRRGFADKIQMAEILLKSLMNVRSTNIYPIQVIIKIES
jgi:hypothetical protein